MAELGNFQKITEDPVIYHKDLRPLEYVVGDAVGRLGAPIYPMGVIDEKLKVYLPLGGVDSGTIEQITESQKQLGKLQKQEANARKRVAQLARRLPRDWRDREWRF